ncbi:hypothetical protein CVT25_002743 [Psilocybe cyanescens]|uniref:Uncharacterized protein n=1 Tax=Psilocybe cyanescens TaxID=93625 RepID=A0A409WL44_PSICY|nr:hypothetical protein CVT25_002743 [Psilocybe cyanescens]
MTSVVSSSVILKKSKIQEPALPPPSPALLLSFHLSPRLRLNDDVAPRAPCSSSNRMGCFLSVSPRVLGEDGGGVGRRRGILSSKSLALLVYGGLVGLQQA